MVAVLIRFIEMVVCSVALSVATRGSIALKIVNSTSQGIGITFFIGMIIFVIIQVFFLRRSFFDLRNRHEYIVYNLTAYFIFAIVSMAVRVLFGNVFHTWTFGIYKFMMFTNAEMLWWQSALYGHAVMIAIIFLAPIGSPAMRAYQLGEEFPEEDEFGNPLPFEDDYGEDENYGSENEENPFSDPFRNLPEEITMLSEDEDPEE